jgi:hypothetical protein
MLKGPAWRLSRSSAIWIGSITLALASGALLGAFIVYATGVDHPISRSPIPVDFCFWVSHEDLFRGQPVETEAKYTQLIEGGSIGKDECSNLDVSNFWARTDDPVRMAWEKDLESNFYAAEFQFTFVGTIPSHPRYVYWLNDARDGWQTMHHITTFRVDRLTHFRRIH